MTARVVLLVVMVGLLWDGRALAGDVTFGQIEVTSHMGEPLRVRIPVQHDPDKPLGGAEALWGVPTNYAHQGGPALKVGATQEAGKEFLVIESDRGMTIPFFTLLLRVAVEGRIVFRNFPVMLADGGQEKGSSGQVGEGDGGSVDGTSGGVAVIGDWGRRYWKGVVLGLLVAIPTGFFVVEWRKRRRGFKGVVSRGLARKRPMATPIVGRQDVVFSEPAVVGGVSGDGRFAPVSVGVGEKGDVAASAGPLPNRALSLLFAEETPGGSGDTPEKSMSTEGLSFTESAGSAESRVNQLSGVDLPRVDLPKENGQKPVISGNVAVQSHDKATVKGVKISSVTRKKVPSAKGGTGVGGRTG